MQETETPVKKAKHAGGAPKGSGLKYTPELVAEILSRMKERTLYQITRDDEDMPSIRTIQTWIATRPEFAAAIADARRAFAQHWIDKQICAVDECDEKNWKSTKVKAWMALELAQRVLPKVYGIQSQLSLTGEVALKTILVAPEREQAALPEPPAKPVFELGSPILDAEFEDVNI